jgi:phosphatidate cytidylyltransferase
MENLSRRLLSSIAITLLIWLALFKWTLGPFFTFLLVGIVMTVGLWELYNLIERKGIRVWRVCGITTGWLLALSGYARLIRWGDRLALEFVAILILFLWTFTLQLRHGNRNAMLTVMGTFFGVFYVAVPLASVFWLYSLEGGRWLILFLIIVTWFNDIGAYFIGLRIGKRKLFPRVSPKKTVEGSIGGMICGVAGVFIIGWILQLFSEMGHFYWAPGTPRMYLHAFVLAVLLSVVGQIGDLTESMLKRDVGVKDSGGTITGHGGILDMIDATLFTIPFTFFFAKSVLLI